MKKILLAATVLGSLVYGGAASAQTAVATTGDTSSGWQAGDIAVRARIIGVIPENNGSSTSLGGHVSATSTAMPEVDLSYFFTDSIAAELIASSTEHTVTANNTILGTQKVGTAWVLPPTVTLQYHFNPHGAFSPYVGAGLNVTWFYATQTQNPVFTKWSLGNTAGPALQVGFDYNVGGPWFLNVDAKQIFINTKAKIDTVVKGLTVTAKTGLDPFVVGAGVGYRF